VRGYRHASASESEGALMAKREGKRSFGMETLPPLPRVYDSTLQEGIGLPFRELEGESTGQIAAYAGGYIQELAARVKLRCSDGKLTKKEKQRDCILLFCVACAGATVVHELAKTFLEEFRGIAEIMPEFPCMFPAHPDKLKSLKDEMWNTFNLGKRNPLKLRAAPGRKTFSFETWVNKLLIQYICKIYSIESWLIVEDAKKVIQEKHHKPKRAHLLPAEVHKDPKRWLDMIWQLLLRDIPEPEKHPQLRKLGEHPSRTERAHFGERKRTGSVKEANRKTDGYIRVAIKEALGKYLVRMLRKEQSDK
jgi:hypothetical protein